MEREFTLKIECKNLLKKEYMDFLNLLMSRNITNTFNKISHAYLNHISTIDPNYEKIKYIMKKYTSRRTSVMAVSEGPTRSFRKWDL